MKPSKNVRFCAYCGEKATNTRCAKCLREKKAKYQSEFYWRHPSRRKELSVWVNKLRGRLVYLEALIAEIEKEKVQ